MEQKTGKFKPNSSRPPQFTKFSGPTRLISPYECLERHRDSLLFKQNSSISKDMGNFLHSTQ
ncbi:MAG: hypothetical protein KDE26_32945, partial [Bacteroidetes bacterium]|nr:hypothetical protein [Bacteroidota bacterium]